MPVAAPKKNLMTHLLFQEFLMRDREFFLFGLTWNRNVKFPPEIMTCMCLLLECWKSIILERALTTSQEVDNEQLFTEDQNVLCRYAVPFQPWRRIHAFFYKNEAQIWPKIKNNVRTIQAGIRNHKVQSLLFLIKLYYFPQTRLYRALKYSRCWGRSNFHCDLFGLITSSGFQAAWLLKKIGK